MTGEDRMDKQVMREQFEAWHRSVVDGDPPHEKYNNGDYRNQHVQRYWIGWQASREAVEVELPSRPHASEEEQERMTDYEIGLGHGGCEEWDKIREKIKAQGLKVKP